MATGGLYTDIKSVLEQAKANAVRAVNFSMVVAYWEIGKRIVKEEQQGEERASYGKGILKDLQKSLHRILVTDFLLLASRISGNFTLYFLKNQFPTQCVGNWKMKFEFKI